MDLLLLLILSYLCGSIPFGLIAGKLFAGKDIRKQGSGNIGATNVTRILGKKIGFITLILDMLKAIIPILIAKNYVDEHQVMLCASFAIIGHIFPIWLKFKGGKGVATAIAVIIFLYPLIGLMLVTTWLVMFWWKKISALSAIIAFACLPIYSIFLQDKILIINILLISILIIYRHKSNIKQMLSR
jgi:acyl phosphate:glycerol-3-phosphate acyltransferase